MRLLDLIFFILFSDLSHNFISGTLPSSLGQLSKLLSLFLNNNLVRSLTRSFSLSAFFSVYLSFSLALPLPLALTCNASG